MDQIFLNTADKMLRELGLIDYLFRLQLSGEYDNRDETIPTACNGIGEPINGRFMGDAIFDLYSQTELFNTQAFKKEFTDRFEVAQNTILIINQAKEIKDKASNILKFIEDNWCEDNYKVQEFMEWAKGDIFDYKHSAVVFVSDGLLIDGVYYEKYIKPNNGRLKMFPINYSCSNQTMIQVCQVVIAFLDKLLAPTTDDEFFSSIEQSAGIIVQDSDRCNLASSLPSTPQQDTLQSDTGEVQPGDNPRSNISTAYEYNQGKINGVYNFSINDIFIGIPLSDFLKCVESADFKDLYTTKGTVKSKLKYIIYILSHNVKDKEWSNWYRQAAASVGTEPRKCSGQNISEGKGLFKGETWKQRADRLK